MKAFQFFLILAVFFGLGSCEPIATFEASQPENARSLNRFPKKLIGTYKKVGGKSEIIVNRSMIIWTKNWIEKRHKNQLDSTETLKGDSLVYPETGQKFKVDFVADSMVVHYVAQDTLFDMDRGDVLKKMKGYYLLNIYGGEKHWEVECLAYHKGMLSIKSIAKNTDLEKLQEITEATSDTITSFNPSKKQFRQFLKQNGFSAEKQYEKVKSGKSNLAWR